MTELLIIKAGDDYFRCRDDHFEPCTLSKATVFPLEQAERARLLCRKLALTGVVAISAGYHSLALRKDGTVVAWGGGYDFGQTNVPVGLNRVIAIAAGQHHSLALKDDRYELTEQGAGEKPKQLAQKRYGEKIRGTDVTYSAKFDHRTIDQLKAFMRSRGLHVPQEGARTFRLKSFSEFNQMIGPLRSQMASAQTH